MSHATANTSPKPQLLIVEDDAAFRCLLTSVLGETFHVETAADGQAAHRALTTSHYDLVLIDVYLPDMPGDHLIAMVRQRAPSTRTVLMSASLYAEHLAQACGAERFFFKGEPVLTIRSFLASLLAAPPQQAATVPAHRHVYQ